MKNLIDVVFSKPKLRRESKIVLIYLIGLNVAKKPLPSPDELDRIGLYDFDRPDEWDTYAVLNQLTEFGYIKGPTNAYTLDYADLAPLVKPLETSGNAPKTAPDLIPSVLELIKLFRKLHASSRDGLQPITGTNDMVMMRSLCKQINPRNMEPLFSRFFEDVTTNRNRLTRYGISDLQKFAERRGYIKKKKFSAK